MTKRREQVGLVTMHSIASAAGVSPMTVSNTFRYPERVQEETRQRVMRIAAELGYVPNHAAGNLASGQSRVIGAIIPSIKNSSFYKYVRGMQDTAAEHGYELVLKLADTICHEHAAIQTFIGLRVAGIALVGNEHEPAAIDILQKTALPVVESWVLGNPIDMAVGYSTTAATKAILDVLLARGYRNIGFIGYERTASHRFTERLPIFRSVLAQAGLSSDLVHLADEADGFGAGPKALEELCRIGPRIDAVICPTDIVAAGVLFECGRRGWKVPDRIAVAGWGDYEIASEITPGLTTVQPNAYEMGQQSVTMIVERARGNRNRGRVVDTGFQIIKRAST
ncbi:LacI family gluconate utilization system Gnt-I transcriptional repressor [Mesorhizobium robiniae]|uniref:LacI family gluconate utilization system Gnt-I transcriptional repressor n=1 Tax=Mesorhizobium robiniae TaxID=559315 RepID=A0ABV2GNY8_9HYPH